ncbi:MAG: adenosylcobalamin-dependent ribonucleoside-diphosphate reductase [Candidatus Aenigmarchaeota archaeon]|nr:adenosylcobalamin-dependent ribonucleoside-diphosphate reductase [Candidatus Aenigmarchaeota archaeon]MDW8149061.1 adenosylcobalamin-dependent ribonucleoside-diphosphate reductase [Candidatus Aenigmarchaeota archaeon]
MIKNIIKRDGRIEDFNPSKIKNAVKKAMIATNTYSEKTLESIVKEILETIEIKFKNKIPHVEEVQDIVESTLVKFNLFDTAKAYILYRKERERIREEKKKILQKDFIDEIDKKFSINALRVLASRYLNRDEKGKIVESPKQLFERVALLIVIPDILYDERVFDKNSNQKIFEYEEFDFISNEFKLGLKDKKFNRYHLERMKYLYDKLNKERKMKVSFSKIIEMLKNGEFDNYYKNFEEYFRIMSEQIFLPNSPTLFNAGNKLGQLSACFVLDIEDDLSNIMDVAKEVALIFKSGGGVGINYSKIRPEGDIVGSTSGIASGPISFMKLIDSVTEVVKQGSKRRGANMGILEVWHPDIEKFITCKKDPNFLQNFNISVMLDKEFFDCYEKNLPFKLINPRNKEIVKEVNPKEILDSITHASWETGDPGVVFLDNINKLNPMKNSLGLIKTTNPCGEEPLYYYESCNLGSINIHKFVENNIFNWDNFRKCVRTCLRFLDNSICINKFPLEKIEEVTKKLRRVGLGIMGLAKALFALKIPYNSEDGFEFMKRIAENLTFYAFKESIELAKRRGSFPLFEKSFYIEGKLPIEGFYEKNSWSLNWDEIVEEIKKFGLRNVEVTCIAPTGSISMIADTTSGIEPQFALVFEKRVSIGEFFYVDEEFEKELKKRNLFSEKLLREISNNGGSIQDIETIPEDMKKIFVTAYDIPWWDHLRAQYEFQKWICSAISKTINLPNWISKDEIKKIILASYKLGLKGITIYRDGSRNAQVLITPSQRKGRYSTLNKNNTLNILKSIGIEVGEIEKKTEIYKRFGEIFCENCKSERVVFQDTCVKCLDCDWAICFT